MIFRASLLVVSALLSFLSLSSAQYDDAEQAKRDMMVGMQGLKAAKENPELMAQLMRDMANPEMMKEAQKMMQDPTWQKEMKKFQESPDFKESIKKTKEMLKDPHAAAQAEAKMEHMLKTGQDKHKQSVQAAMDQAMDSFNNPEMIREMQKMVQDPSFKKQFEEMAKNPEFAGYIQAVSIEISGQIRYTQFSH